MKKTNEQNTEIDKVQEVESESHSSPPRSSHRNSSHTGSPRTGSHDSKSEAMLERHEIERLENEIKRISAERDHFKACLENNTKTNNLEREIKGLMQEQEESQKAFQTMHEAKVLIKEFNQDLGLPLQDEFIANLQTLIEACRKSQETLKETINAFEGEMKNKNLHIEALISDVNQMKEFIIEHHGESVFEGEDKEEVQEHVKEEEAEAAEETITEATEATEIKEEQESLIILDEKEETPKTKVTVYIEQPLYRNNSYRGYYESSYDRDFYDRRRPYRYSRPWNEDRVVYQPKNSSRGFEEKEKEREEYSSRYNARDNRGEIKEIKESKFDPFRERKTREEDPVYKQLETMIKELNEKLISNEKKAKKFCEEKLLEASKMQSEKEEGLLAEVEKLKEDKKELLKKIDDMQWEQAYAYTQKAKMEKQEEEKALEAANKQKIASLESNKKKKKK